MCINDMKNKTVLALDCASKTCSVALYKDGKVRCSVDTDTEKTHSLTLLPSVKAALDLTGSDMSQVDMVAVTAGPGSFTGLKIGVTTAKGLAFPNDLPCAAVSSMTALAYGCLNFEGLVCPSFDARRSMLYNALFFVSNGKVERLCEDRQSAASEVAEELKTLASRYGNRVLLAGDGASVLFPLLSDSELSVSCDGSGVKASAIITAVISGDCQIKESATLVPDYLRPSQAERERNERLKNNSSIKE